MNQRWNVSQKKENDSQKFKKIPENVIANSKLCKPALRASASTIQAENSNSKLQLKTSETLAAAISFQSNAPSLQIKP